MRFQNRYIAFNVQGLIISVPIFSIWVLEANGAIKFAQSIALLFAIIYICFAIAEKPLFLFRITVQPLSLSATKKMFAGAGVVAASIFIEMIFKIHGGIGLISVLIAIALFFWAYFEEKALSRGVVYQYSEDATELAIPGQFRRHIIHLAPSQPRPKCPANSICPTQRSSFTLDVAL